MYQITIETGNAAFCKDEGAEVARILKVAAEDISAGHSLPRKLMDHNGNVCGEVTYQS